ncbi:uncharacterized protein SPAPADRAFT_151152 [Spathaspora passalidarum NRRL Y-27907]|uniref:Uncharacterized protein n=1 Tax=Spathaspora passalidarum (strain NRRL Y-27907 / 11-Y1) TaxID=619300 RepID=G3ALP3_SPAPN|nr:uncharacterized protein SPAPADRAFT_151152 [Spathaspora passalidarum NRRL Y-27907]EGW33286.1 hypothetical protein SPAPADRAFT_151152 [Spathaspora passalidarum NRRL Y-27907]
MIGTDCYHIVIDLNRPDTYDYRYSPLHITEIDITNTSQPMNINSIEPIKAKSINQGGIIRLYREFEEEHDNFTIAGDDTMVSILAVPTYFTATDLLGFIGDSYLQDISHIRILKSEKQNRFLVLIKFRSITTTAEFQFNFNGKPFNSMEPETCHVVYVTSVEINYADNSDSNPVDSLIPFLLQDPFTSKHIESTSTELEQSSSHAQTQSHANATVVELPTCPVCLERMDSTVTGLLTIPCQHTFHCQCLSKWKDDTCPICRYSHVRSLPRIRRSSSSAQAAASVSTLLHGDEEDQVCMECNESSNLWICLVCGNVGCSRYSPDQHSLKHFVNTGHCFSMEIATSRVWDYAGDNYVHRLVTNESDGKLVELPDKEKPECNTTVDKVDEVGFEYSQLLISQLASQREYYESLLDRRRGSTSSNDKLTQLQFKVEDLTSKLSDLTANLIPSLKEKIQLKDEKLNTVIRELNISNSLNDALSKKIEFYMKDTEEYKKQIDDLTQDNKELHEQVKDLMFFLDSQEKFKDESDEIKNGTIVVQPSARTGAKKTKKKCK